MLLDIQALSAGYSGIRALREIAMQVDEGEMVAIIGPNGAGKSTLLNTISGFVTTDPGGAIRFRGQDLRGKRPHAVSRLGILHVPEGRQILMDLTVAENLQLGALARGRRPARFDQAFVEELFPVLAERRQQIAGTMSGGQQQMLAIGRALMGSPDLMLLDEPSLGLSPLITDQVFAALTRLNREGLTVVLVEQNARRALAASDRTYVLEGGRIAMSGRSADLAHDPAVLSHYLGEGEPAD